MAKIVLYTSGTLGDHLPFIALGQGLTARGHRVCMAINQAMHSYAQAVGLQTASVGEEYLGPEQAQSEAWAWDHWNNPDPASDPRTQKLPFEHHMAQVRNLMELCGDADLLIAASIRLLGYIVANTLEIPWLTVSLSPYTFWAPSTQIQFKERNELHQREYGRLSQIADQTFDELGEAKRVQPWTPGWMYGRHVIMASSPSFGQPDLDQLQPGHSIDMAGFWLYQNPAWADWKPDEDLRKFCEPQNPDQKPLVLAFSSQPLTDPAKILQRHVLAAIRLNRPLLVQRGWAGFSQKDLPPQADVDSIHFADFIPHDWLFARAACSIQHGGIGSIARALMQGCPLLVEPFGNDQIFNATQVQNLGVGSALHPFESNLEQLVETIQNQVLTAACRRRAAVLGELIKGESGVDNACDMIDRLLIRVGPDRSYPGIYKRFTPPLTPRVRQSAKYEPDIKAKATPATQKARTVQGFIPKIIHQTWKDRNLPVDYSAWQRSWIEHHPDWKYYLWTDADNQRFLQEHYPWFLPIYYAYPENIMRVDAIRYFILNHFGGVYADLDFECLRPIEPLLDGKSLVFGLEPDEHLALHKLPNRGLDRIVCNAFMASAQGHPFWEHLYKQLIAYHKSPGPLDAAGPFMLTRACDSYPQPEQISIEPAELLYPIHGEQIWSQMSPVEKDPIRKTAYAVHHWRGTWWRPVVGGISRKAPVELLDQGLELVQLQADLDGCLHVLDKLERQPLVSCLMVTRDRFAMARRAIRCFQKQTYTQKELVVLDDSPDDSLQNWIEQLEDDRIKYHRLETDTMNLGQLRNHAVEQASGDYVTQWDDDDLSAPLRLEVQMSLVHAYRVDACMLVRHTLWWPQYRRMALSTYRVWEGSFVCRRDMMSQYPEQPKGEDTPVINKIIEQGRVILLDLPKLYLYVFHGDNTFGQSHWETHWETATETFEQNGYEIKLADLENIFELDLSEAPEALEAAPSPLEPFVEPDPLAAPQKGETEPDSDPDAESPRSGKQLVLDSLSRNPTVLILVPVKDASGFLPAFLDRLEHLSYPSDLISLAFMEGDSRDGTYDYLMEALPRLRECYTRVELFKQDYTYHSSSPRWVPSEQLRRRSILAKSRNQLLTRALNDEEWVLWIDVDLASWPNDIIERLLASGKEIVVPNCLKAGSSKSFDLNSFKLKPGAETLNWREYILDGILQPPKGFGRHYLSDLRQYDEVELDGVGGTMLLVKADLHREGLIYPSFPYKHFIETEGLAAMARDMGHTCWGLPNLEIFHP